MDDPHGLLRPFYIYENHEIERKTRLFMCPDCKEEANGQHQCGSCYAHMHATCGVEWPDQYQEGYGPSRLCIKCQDWWKPPSEEHREKTLHCQLWYDMQYLCREYLAAKGYEDSPSPDTPGYDVWCRAYQLDVTDTEQYEALKLVLTIPNVNTTVSTTTSCLYDNDRDVSKPLTKGTAGASINRPRKVLLNLKKSRMARKSTATDATAASLLPTTLDMVTVPRDGNCMFHALAISVASFALTHEDIREKIVAHIIRNWNNNTTMYCEWIQAKYPSQTAETYKNRMLGKLKDWGDEPELVAAASIFETTIEILEYIDGAAALTSTIIDCPGTAPQEVPGIRLLRVGRNHYHAGILYCVAQPPSLDERTSYKCLSMRTVLTKVGVDLQSTTAISTGDEKRTEVNANEERQELLELGDFISNLQSVVEGSQHGTPMNAVVGAARTATVSNDRELVRQTQKKRKKITSSTPYFGNDTTTLHSLSTNGSTMNEPKRKNKKKRKWT